MTMKKPKPNPAADPCLHCGEPTAFGSGRFVNRVPGDREDKDGYLIEGYSCAECLQIECDKCGEPIPLDEDHKDPLTGEGFYHAECIETPPTKPGRRPKFTRAQAVEIRQRSHHEWNCELAERYGCAATTISKVLRDDYQTIEDWEDALAAYAALTGGKE